MKRSQINAILCDAVEFIRSTGFLLPPFACLTPEMFAEMNSEYDELRDNMLGWDVTDFGSGDYEKIGLLMFTVRNGNYHNSKYVKPYAEKILIVGEGQVTPYHFHYKKMEDIINRGGGNLVLKVYNSAQDESFANTPVAVSMDGRNFTVPAGTELMLHPGESITFPCGMYHSFWGEVGKGKILVGEVSKVNDDRIDNRFYEKVGRFPAIDEDEKPLYLLSMDYPDFNIIK